MGTEKGRLADTREFLAAWNAAKEEHFVQELVPLLPQLGQTTEAVARHIVRALRLASTSEGGVAAGMDYLAKVGESDRSGT